MLTQMSSISETTICIVLSNYNTMPSEAGSHQAATILLENEAGDGPAIVIHLAESRYYTKMSFFQ